jgi:hypothetical protein
MSYCYNRQNTHLQMACAREFAASGSASLCEDNGRIVDIIVGKRLTFDSTCEQSQWWTGGK